MYKSIVYSLLVLGYLGFSTLPFTEVSAQTITQTSSGESGSPGESFAVEFSITGITQSTTLNVYWNGGDIQGSFTNGSFQDLSQFTPLTTDISSDGNYTVYLKVKPIDQLTRYSNTWSIQLTFAGTNIEEYFSGDITGILYFPSASTTRSVAEDAVVGAPIGTPISAIYPKQQIDALNSNNDPNDDIIVRYILEGTDKDSFRIDRKTGQLRVKTPLDYDIKRTYSVTVKVELQHVSRTSFISNSATIAVRINVNAPEPPVAVVAAEPQIIILECPVGWQRTDRFAQPNPRVLIHQVNLEMDLHNRVSIYKPNSVAIYVHPDEGLENLEGWKLQVAILYNHHRDYLLTAENSVVVDANIEGVEGGFAFIESPEEAPFPMVGMGFTGAHVPGFDYRLYDDTGRRVDFGIACYKRGGIFQALKEMEDPRVLRNVLLESLDWDAATYIRSEWTVPTPAPAAPSQVKGNIVGTWANLKKQ